MSASIDLTTEPLLIVSDAARFIPGRQGQPTPPSRIVRWITVGVRVRGQRIRLEAVWLGGSWFTTARALREFGERLTASKLGKVADPVQPAALPELRRRQVEQAERYLEQAGI